MLAARPFLGGVFVAILAIGLIYAVTSPLLQPIRLPRINLPWLGSGQYDVLEKYTLLKGVNVSGGVRSITMNLTMQFGGVNLFFSNDPGSALNLRFGRTANSSALRASYAEISSSQSQVELFCEAGEVNVTLGKDYQYGGGIDLRVGVIMMELAQNTNVSRMIVSIKYAGGMLLRIGSGASFGRLELGMDVGGLQLEVKANNLESSGVIDAKINIGGFSMSVEVDSTRVGVSLNAAVDVGGLVVTSGRFDGSVSSKNVAVKTLGYTYAPARLDVEATIGLGGGTLQ